MKDKILCIIILDAKFLRVRQYSPDFILDSAPILSSLSWKSGEGFSYFQVASSIEIVGFRMVVALMSCFVTATIHMLQMTVVQNALRRRYVRI